MPQKIQSLIIQLIEEMVKEHPHAEASVNPQTHILADTPLDSLDLAIILIKLEEKTGKDPFKGGFIPFTTVEELAKFYE